MKNRNWALLLVFFLPFFVYLPTLSGGFYYDDNVIFFGHQAKALADNPFSVFNTAEGIPGVPRSLHVFFLLLLYKVFGSNPLPYHLFTLLVHSATALLVYRFLDKARVGANIAMLAGLIFGLHPAHVENITFVTLGGTDMFYIFWAMWSLLCYVSFRLSGNGGVMKWLTLFASVVFYIFALMSKESAASFIFVYPLVEVLIIRKGFLWAIPHLTALLFMKWSLLNSASTSILTGSLGGFGHESGSARNYLEAVKAFGFTFKTLLLPYPLTPMIKEFRDPILLYVMTAIALFITLASIMSRNKILIFSTLFFVFGSAPYLIAPYMESNIAIFAERYMYAPSVGFAILLSALLTMLLVSKPKILTVISLLLLTAYGATGIYYFNKSWRTEEAFWQTAMESNPEYITGYVSLAGVSIEKGEIEKAKGLLNEGLKKKKGMSAEFAQGAYILGTLALRENNTNAAESYFQMSLQYSAYEFSFTELGFIYLKYNNNEKAKWAFENSLRFPTNSSRAMLGLAIASYQSGEVNSAKLYASKVLARSGDERLRQVAKEILSK